MEKKHSKSLAIIIIGVILLGFLMMKFYNQESRNVDPSSLEIHLETNKKFYKTGDKIEANLYFKNNGDQNIRIYMINSEAFRFNQSNLSILNKGTNELIDIYPLPLPHGYIVTEKDFHLIKPGEEISFQQKIPIDSSKIKNSGNYILKWTYQNEITMWAGNTQTLDGTTKELFDGKEIPNIWTGKTEQEIEFHASAQRERERGEESGSAGS